MMPTYMLQAMTRFPYSIDADASVGDADRMMRQRGIRHLPVTTDGEVYSVLSEREVRDCVSNSEEHPEKTAVRTLCALDPYIVTTDDALSDVLEVMSERRIGCALVVENDRVAGIYTTVDACRQFASALRNVEHSLEPND